MGNDFAKDALARQIDAILDDTSLNGDSVEESKVELIEDLIGHFSWLDVREYLYSILLSDRASAHWYTAAEVFFGAVLDGRDIDGDYLIALLYYRFRPTKEQDENNLVWSITAAIKNLDYLSDYDPLDDPEIIAKMKKLKPIVARKNSVGPGS